MTIAIVEDEPKLATVLARYLQQAGFATEHYVDGKLALDALRNSPPDLILLDLMLPGLDGMSLCQELRKVSNVPIIMTTARVEEIDRLLGLEIGADDYICKPYSPREVVARVKTVLRRTKSAETDSEAPTLILSPETASVTIQGQSVSLTKIELSLLQALTQRPGHILAREQLMQRIYPDRRVVSDRTIDSHVKKLRAKLRSASGGIDFVQSVYGIGYRFEPAPE
jgi:two-component system response regulator BaeR